MFMNIVSLSIGICNTINIVLFSQTYSCRELLAKKKKGLTNEEEDSEVLDMSALESEDKAKAQLEDFVPAETITG